MSLKLLSILISLLLFWGCAPSKMGSSLLMSADPCNLVSATACGNNPSTIITGTLNIAPDNGEIAVPVETTDLVEITGTCNDLGRRDNRIIVQVFEGDDEAAAPIIDNSSSSQCESHITTSSLQPSAGVGKTCLLISDGVGRVGDGEEGSAPRYPQCFNGKFGFQIRLGRIIRKDLYSTSKDETVNPLANYTVRMKMMAMKASIAEYSLPVSMKLKRYIAQPIFSVAAAPSQFRCEISLTKSAIFKDVRYTLEATAQGSAMAQVRDGSGVLTWDNAISGTVYVSMTAVIPPVSNGTGVDLYYHDKFPSLSNLGFMPGVNYKYRMRAEDWSYTTDYAHLTPDHHGIRVENSGYKELTCSVPAARIVTKTQSYQDSSGSYGYENGAGSSGSGYGCNPPVIGGVARPPTGCRFVLSNVNSPSRTFSCSGGGTRVETRYDNMTSVNFPLGGWIEWRYSKSSPTWMSGGSLPADAYVITSCSGSPASNGKTICEFYPGVATNDAANGNVLPAADPANPKTYYIAARQFIDTNGNDMVDPGEFAGEWSPVGYDTSGAFMNSCAIPAQ